MQAPEPGLALPLSLRQGLPHQFLYHHGLQPTLAAIDDPSIPTASTAHTGASGIAAADEAAVVPQATADVAKTLAQRLREAADTVEACGTVVTSVAGSLARDFMRSRLPPPREQLPPQGPVPTLKSHICSRAQVCSTIRDVL